MSCRRTVPHCPLKGAYSCFLSSIVLITDLRRRHEEADASAGDRRHLRCWDLAVSGRDKQNYSAGGFGCCVLLLSGGPGLVGRVPGTPGQFPGDSCLLPVLWAAGRFVLVGFHRSLPRRSFWASASRLLFLLSQPALRHSTHLPVRKQPEEVMLEIPVPPTSSGYILKIKT